MASTLVIGIGTSGLKIIEEAQQYHYEFTGRNKPDNTAYVYIETDLNKSPRTTAGGETEIEQIELDLSNLEVSHKEITNNSSLDSSWLPKPSDINNNLNGAGGMPAFGRFGFWSNRNYQNLKTKISSKYQQIHINGEITNVLIVGSLCGGTGSGICVDLAYLIKHTLQIQNVYGLLLLPDIVSVSKNKNLHINAFSAYSTIDFYNHEDNEYKVTWPDGSNYKDSGAPFKNCRFISQDFSNSNASIPSKNLSELVKVAGMQTMLHFANSDLVTERVTDVLDERTVDRGGAGRLSNLQSNGFYMIQYPKAQLKELLSIKVCKELIRKLTDTEYYRNQSGNKKGIKNDKILFENQAKKKIEDLIKDLFEDLNGITTQDEITLTNSFDNDIATIISKKHGTTDKRYIHNKFSSDSDDNYFHLLKNNSSVITNSIIDNLHQLVIDISEKYKNLTISKLYIDSISDHIDDLLKYYEERYNLRGTDENWKNVLGNQITTLYENSLENELTLQKKSYLKYIFNELNFILKINILIPELKKIKNAIIGKDSLESTAGNRLPSVKIFNETISKLNNVKDGEGSDTEMTLSRRKGELDEYLDKFTSCFKMVYASGIEKNSNKGEKKEEDIETAFKEYNKGKKLNYINIFGDSIWNFSNSPIEKIYSTVIKNSMKYMENQSYFKENDLVSILGKLKNVTVEENSLKKLLEENKEYIKKYHVPAMVKLKTNEYRFIDDDYAKLIVITSDHNKYQQLFKEYNISGDSNSVNISHLNDVIIFYQEYSFLGDTNGEEDKTFSPMIHLDKIDEVKEIIKNNLKDLNRKTDSFFRVKFPNHSKEQLKEMLK